MLLIPTLLCPKAWETMSGSDKERFCSYCQKKVHNLGMMSVRQRLALLSSPAAQICSRYRMAIRRPRPAHRQSYTRHLMKYGAGVAVAGTALVVLWEIHGGRPGRTSLYRAVAPTSIGCGLGPEEEMPADFYEEIETVTIGMIAIAAIKPPDPAQPAGSAAATPHVDVAIDHPEITRLFEQLPAPALTRLPAKK